MTTETFDFSKTSRWTLFKMLATAFVSRRLSLAWTAPPTPDPKPEIVTVPKAGTVTRPHAYE